MEVRTDRLAQKGVSKPYQPSGVARTHKQIQKQVHAGACDIRTTRRCRHDLAMRRRCAVVGRGWQHKLRPHAESEVLQTRDCAGVIVVTLQVVCIDNVLAMHMDTRMTLRKTKLVRLRWHDSSASFDSQMFAMQQHTTITYIIQQ